MKNNSEKLITNKSELLYMFQTSSKRLINFTLRGKRKDYLETITWNDRVFGSQVYIRKCI